MQHDSLTSLSKSLINGTGSQLTPPHESIAIQLLNSLQQYGLVDENSIVDSDCEDDLIIRWSDAGLVCERFGTMLSMSQPSKQLGMG